MKKFWNNIKELIFVVYKTDDGGLTAIEGNVGLIARGDDEASLESDVRFQVAEFFGKDFTCTVRLRWFTDVVLTIKPSDQSPG
ncbi:hypothetical protein ACFQRK_11775 [Parapedobacter sp. GCM10030251]|uniref:hypothetical protein n=1 Tax=Parapedobacter sp. GCM10030251 TaxID=3273419 RepID=UPI0036160D5A